MSCTTCNKLRPFPECLADGETMTLTGIDFGSETLATILITDTATGRNQILDSLDVSEIFPLMNHTYEMQFFNEDMEQIPFTIDTDVTGCCLEFNIIEGMVFSGGNFLVTTSACEV